MLRILRELESGTMSGAATLERSAPDITEVTRMLSQSICSIPGCERPVRARGWCSTHYSWWRTRGEDPALHEVRRSPGSQPECSVDDCGLPTIARGLCQTHYWRARHDKPLAEPIAAYGRPFEERVEERIRREPNGCWVWTGTVNLWGYGIIQPPKGINETGHTITVHRWMYEKYVGPIPPRYQIDHLCLNKLCVNYAHLEAVTQAENLRRGPSPVGKPGYGGRPHHA